uniref:Uncharacterized protein n=1 Tax=Cucumis melo TaxID=3656 RepID=A0A9I9E0X9_CUCME
MGIQIKPFSSLSVVSTCFVRRHTGRRMTRCSTLSLGKWD